MIKKIFQPFATFKMIIAQIVLVDSLAIYTILEQKQDNQKMVAFKKERKKKCREILRLENLSSAANVAGCLQEKYSTTDKIYSWNTIKFM